MQGGVAVRVALVDVAPIRSNRNNQTDLALKIPSIFQDLGFKLFIVAYSRTSLFKINICIRVKKKKISN